MADAIKWGKGRLADFVEYCDTELTDAIQAHDTLVKKWTSQLEQYRAPAQQPEKNHPYQGAANYVLPLTAIDVDQLFAKEMQTVHAPDNLWTTSPMNERWTDAAKPMQDLLTWIDRNLIKMWNVNKRAVLEKTKLGTAIYKTGWTYEKRPVWTYDELGRVIKVERIRGVPFVDHVRLPNFLIPAYSYAIQPDDQGGAPWVGEIIRVPVARLWWLANSASPMLPSIDKETLELIIKFEESGATSYDEYIRRAERERLVSLESDTDWDKSSDVVSTKGGVGGLKRIREIEFVEIHARFPTRDTRSEDDVIAWFHRPTRKLVRGVYQYYRHGAREYDVVRLFPGDGFYGIGLCEQKEVFQTVASDLFNFNYDNVLLANSRMVVAKSGSNIAPGEPFYPNKVWIVDDDINKSFGVFPMADIYPSLPQLQAQVQSLGERRTGISDIQLGNIQELPGRTPATTMLSLLQEGNRRPDLTIKDLRYEGLSTVGLRIIQLIQQYAGSPIDVGGQNLLRLAVETLGMPEGMVVAEKLLTPFEDAALGLGVSITATSGSANKEVERQNYLTLLQLAGQLYPQFIQTVQMGTMFAGTPAGEVALKSATGLAELFQRALEQWDVRNSEEIIPVTDATAQQAREQGLQQAAAGAGAGPGGPDSGAGPDAGLQALLGGAGAPV